MWTLCQEVDDGINYKIDMLVITYIDMCAYFAKHDPYKNPTSAHQLNAASISATGDVPVRGIDGAYNVVDVTKTEFSGTIKSSNPTEPNISVTIPDCK